MPNVLRAIIFEYVGDFDGNMHPGAIRAYLTRKKELKRLRAAGSSSSSNSSRKRAREPEI
jgi:hypothetical protein